MTVHIGFTGTREGMTLAQQDAVIALLAECIFIGHHGDCVGADEQFDMLGRRSRGFVSMVIHPSTHNLRAFCKVTLADDVRAATDPLTRNRDIVSASDWMIAAPKSAVPEARSGTWATIRYAQSAGKSVVICLPDGTWVE